MASRAERSYSTAHIGLFMALAAFLQVAETIIPSPAPWFRLGLGNALVLTALSLWGVRAGAWVALGKVLVGSLITGRLLSPGFLLSCGGTVAATTAMAFSLRLPLGFVGVSVIGAAAHALAQLFVAGAVLLGTSAVWGLAPLVGVSSIASGIATGIAAGWLARVVAQALSAPADTA